MKNWRYSWKHLVGMFIIVSIINVFLLKNNGATFFYGAFAVDIGISFILGYLIELSQVWFKWGTYDMEDVNYSVYGGFLSYIVFVVIKLIIS